MYTPQSEPSGGLLTGQGGGRHCLLLEIFVKEVGGGEDRVEPTTLP